jgi:crossover junction endodeoxyribonuclease RusA
VSDIIYTFTVPGVPPSLNVWARSTTYPQARAKKGWEQAVWALVNERGNRCPRPLAHAELLACITFRQRRRRDAENFGACLWKFTCDGLVKAGIIPDDTPQYVTTYTPELVVGDVEQTQIMIRGRLEP